MKKIILSIVLSISMISSYGQDFAPVGAEWYFNEQFSFSGNIDYIKLTSEKDTLIFGEICRKITKRHKIVCNDRPETEYLFYRNDTVFFLDTIFNAFQILYDFNAMASDSWMIRTKDEEQEIDTLTITVDSVSTTLINDHNLKTLYVTYFKDDEFMPHTYNSIIIEKIGDIQYMFNWYPWSNLICDGNYSTGLRCYQDSEIGLYSTGIADSCDYVYIWSGIEHTESSGSIELFPNPAQYFVDIRVKDHFNYSVDLFDWSGKLLKSEQAFDSNFRLDLSRIDKGSYVVLLKSNNQIIGYRKLIKE